MAKLIDRFPSSSAGEKRELKGWMFLPFSIRSGSDRLAFRESCLLNPMTPGAENERSSLCIESSFSWMLESAIAMRAVAVLIFKFDSSLIWRICPTSCRRLRPLKNPFSI